MQLAARADAVGAIVSYSQAGGSAAAEALSGRLGIISAMRGSLGRLEAEETQEVWGQVQMIPYETFNDFAEVGNSPPIAPAPSPAGSNPARQAVRLPNVNPSLLCPLRVAWHIA